jgi:hypothetical protein
MKKISQGSRHLIEKLLLRVAMKKIGLLEAGGGGRKWPLYTFWGGVTVHMGQPGHVAVHGSVFRLSCGKEYL